MSEISTLIPTDPFARLSMTFRLDHVNAQRDMHIADVRDQVASLVASARERGLVVMIHEDQATFSTIFTIDKPTNPETK